VSINRAKVLKSAQKHLAKGNLDKAIAEYAKIVEADPSDARSLLKLGDIYTKKGAHKEAGQSYRRVAEQYSEQGFFLKAVAVYKQILKLDNTQLDAWERLAEMYELLSLVSDALAAYEQIAEAYLRGGHTAQAIDAMGRMVALDPENVASCIKYAEALSKCNRKAEAVEAFTGGATLLKKQGRMDDYVKVAERLLYHSPDDGELARELSGLYLERGDARHALAKLQTCFKDDPKNVETLRLLARAFRELGQTQKSIAVYKELARVEEVGGNAAGQASAMRGVLALDPNDADAKRVVDLLGDVGTEELSVEPEGIEIEDEDEDVIIVDDDEDEDPSGVINIADSGARPMPMDEDDDDIIVVDDDDEDPPTHEFEQPLSEAENLFAAADDEPSEDSVTAIIPVEDDEPSIELSSPDDDEEDDGPELIIEDASDDDDELFAEAEEAERMSLAPPSNPTQTSPAPIASMLAPPLSDEAAIAFEDEEEEEAETQDTSEDEDGELPEEIADAIEEADFYLQQGETEEALESLNDALEEFPGHAALLAKIAEAKGEEPGDGQDDAFAMAAKLADEAKDAKPVASKEGGEVEVSDVISQFRDGVAAAVDEGDAATHYDLGIAFMEMGLHLEAVDEFKLCLSDPDRVCQAQTMIGLAHVARAEPEPAITHFQAALDANPTDSGKLDLWFEIGNAYEFLNKANEALIYFEKVEEIDSDYREVASRIERLGVALSKDDEDEEFDEMFDNMILKE